MKRNQKEELDIKSSRGYLAFDQETGNVLVTHEVLDESGCQKPPSEEEDEALMRQVVRHDFGSRRVKLKKLDQDPDWNPEEPCKVDPATGKIVRSPKRTMLSYRNFINGEPDPIPDLSARAHALCAFFRPASAPENAPWAISVRLCRGPPRGCAQ
jgi:hypothetical protein